MSGGKVYSERTGIIKGVGDNPVKAVASRVYSVYLKTLY